MMLECEYLKVHAQDGNALQLEGRTVAGASACWDALLAFDERFLFLGPGLAIYVCSSHNGEIGVV
jgi:hypothetical protein